MPKQVVFVLILSLTRQNRGCAGWGRKMGWPEKGKAGAQGDVKRTRQPELMTDAPANVTAPAGRSQALLKMTSKIVCSTGFRSGGAAPDRRRMTQLLGLLCLNVMAVGEQALNGG